MKASNFRKESSERSDSSNWAKNLLIEKTPYHFDSIEGCNQNQDNQVTHLFERARIDLDENLPDLSPEELLSEIINIEGKDSLIRKINFANCFGLSLHYVLYCDEKEIVFLYEIQATDSLHLKQQFSSYQEFSDWIKGIKGWVSSKSFREKDDLPEFDKALRKAGTAWPTNIDCFVCDENNNPISIIEFQNAKNTGVLQHSNNDHFQCKISTTKEGFYGPYPVYHDDIRRWTSLEILRIQSGLKLIIITWSQVSQDFQIKELDKVSIPFFPEEQGKIDWKYMAKYKGALHQYVNSNRNKEIENNISENAKTYNLTKEENTIKTNINEPPLSYENKTFPALYYSQKEKIQNNREGLADLFQKML